MITDAHQLVEGSSLEADVCIVGSGPAGMSLALALQGRGLHVLLLEAGGLEFDAEGHALYEGESECNVSDAFDEYLTGSRARFLGGTSNLWAGWCRPLQPEDFEVRSWVPHSGWPLSYADLEAYYDAATAYLDVVPFPGPEAWEGSSRPPLALDPDLLETRVWQFSGPTRFGTRYLADLEASTDIELVLDANLVGSRQAAGGVEVLELTTLSGHTFEARGRAVVLACGGIENARLMLALGLGNDLTGRFFHEHPGIRGSMELQVSREALTLYTERAVDEVLGSRCMGLLALPAEVQASEQLVNQAVMLRSVGDVERDDASRATEAWLTHTTGRAPVVGLAMAMGEQTPNPDSRITLLPETDAFGMPRARLDWQLLPADWESLLRSLELTADGLAAAGVGRGRMNLERDEPWPTLSPGFHAMGTTRMASGPADGVVDSQCRVFGLDNLYIAGSSVFPTGGAANPTLTIVALALRLADHLGEVL